MKLKTLLTIALFAPMFANAHGTHRHDIIWDNANPLVDEASIVVAELYTKDTNQFVQCELVIGRENLGHHAVAIYGTNQHDIKYMSTYLYNDAVPWYMILDGDKTNGEYRGKVENANWDATEVKATQADLDRIAKADKMDIYMRPHKTPGHGTKFHLQRVELDGIRSAVSTFRDCLDAHH